MTKKKSNQPKPSQAISTGGLKKGKIRHKQMFNELQTVNQQKINRLHKKQYDDELDPDIKMQEQASDSSYNQEKQLNMSNQKSIEEVCEIVNQLIAKNKVGVKNAFDVPIIDLFEMANFSKDEGENKWKTLSSTFQNDYKIYGYRVDAIHSITYSILNIMARRSTQTQQKPKLQIEKDPNVSNVQSSGFLELKESFLQSEQTQKTHLERDFNKLNIPLAGSSTTSDPTLERTKRLFDEPGLKGMLTNSININKNLELSLFSNLNHEPYSMKLSQLEEQIDPKNVEHPLKVFQSIEKIKTDFNKIIGSGQTKVMTNKELEQIWNNVKKGAFNDWAQGNQKVWLDVQDPRYRESLDMMIDENSENHANFENNKFISDFIKTKNHQAKKTMTDAELILDGQKWLNEIDKKFLGIKSSGSSSKVVQLPMKSAIKNFDDINFDFIQDEELTRQQILKKESLPKQFNQEIQDRFLTTIRPFNEFRIQKILTLRQEPYIQLHAIEEQLHNQHQYDQEHFLQRQIDVKRQMTSIKDIKQSLYDEIQTKKMSTFGEIYNGYCKREEQISPALCFLTLLHLANEKNLYFESIQNQTDYIIRVEGK